MGGMMYSCERIPPPAIIRYRWSFQPYARCGVVVAAAVLRSSVVQEESELATDKPSRLELLATKRGMMERSRSSYAGTCGKEAGLGGVSVDEPVVERGRACTSLSTEVEGVVGGRADFCVRRAAGIGSVFFVGSLVAASAPARLAGLCSAVLVSRGTGATAAMAAGAETVAEGETKSETGNGAGTTAMRWQTEQILGPDGLVFLRTSKPHEVVIGWDSFGHFIALAMSRVIHLLLSCLFARRITLQRTAREGQPTTSCGIQCDRNELGLLRSWSRQHFTAAPQIAIPNARQTSPMPAVATFVPRPAIWLTLHLPGG
ncbi:hypothetical protein F5148DRAFT_1147137 [Russula earlei]|uniref:Uncharacterized protein n=1 Tax=Russula earlei TaxID=71964 RepID=A0ACC0UH70_9AGAM|nr:hypothetical protein F5148DRAFT_1147137 [Russula earlei]